MNNQIKGLLFYFYTHMKRAFLIFWSILLGILILSLVASYILKGQDGIMTFAIALPMYFFSAIYGFTIVKKWLPYFLKVGATRRNIYIGIGLFFMGISASFALIAELVQQLGNLIVRALEIDIFSFLHLSMFFEDAWYVRLIIDFTIMLILCSFMFLLGLLFYKYGLLISGIVLGSLFFGLIFSAFKGWILTFADYIQAIDFHLFWQLALLALALYGLSWLLLRRITTLDG